MSNYELLAKTFTAKHNVKMQINSVNYGKYFADDKQSRHIFNITLKRNRKQYTFNFGQSIAAGSKEPTMYDILTCLEKYESIDFTDFCGNYGYDEDSRKAYKTYLAVKKEYNAVNRLFSDCMEELQEIQ
jgi:hypothetical protein